MTLTDLAWLALAAYAVHILEEYQLNWRDWARAVVRLPVEWGDFYVTNAVVVVLGIAQAGLAATVPLAPLTFAALMLVNATFFHVLPFVRTGGRFSPGLITAVLLFYPLGVTMFLRAAVAGALTWPVGLAAVGLAAILMATPILFLKVRSKPFFRQDR